MSEKTDLTMIKTYYFFKWKQGVERLKVESYNRTTIVRKWLQAKKDGYFVSNITSPKI